jgi:esterase/lipase
MFHDLVNENKEYYYYLFNFENPIEFERKTWKEKYEILLKFINEEKEYHEKVRELRKKYRKKFPKLPYTIFKLPDKKWKDIYDESVKYIQQNLIIPKK